METLEKKLVLDREVARLITMEKQLKSKVERLEAEQLEILDLKVRRQKEVTELDEKKQQVLRDIQEEKTAWASQKATEEDTLNRDKLDTKKILNREDWVNSQEVKIKEEFDKLTNVSQGITVREKALSEGLEFLDREKKQIEKDKQAGLKLVEDEKVKLLNLKAQFIRAVNEL